MNMERAQADRSIATVPVEDRGRPLQVHAELGLLLARRQVGVGLVVDIRIHTQSGLHRHRRSRRLLLHDPDEVLQLLLRLDVEVRDARLQGRADLFVGLAHAGIDHLGRVGSRGQGPVQLAATDDVETTALPGHQFQDVNVAAGLDGETDHRLQRGIRLLDLVQMVQEGGLTVDVSGRAHLGGDAPDVHLLGEQPAVLIMKPIHKRALSWGRLRCAAAAFCTHTIPSIGKARGIARPAEQPPHTLGRGGAAESRHAAQNERPSRSGGPCAY
jgi:hypothetical protein